MNFDFEISRVDCICFSGHVADALQRSDPDVYVSSDGGYSWRLVCNYVLLVKFIAAFQNCR